MCACVKKRPGERKRERERERERASETEKSRERERPACCGSEQPYAGGPSVRKSDSE